MYICRPPCLVLCGAGKPRRAMEEKALRVLGLDADLGLPTKPASPNKLHRTVSLQCQLTEWFLYTFRYGKI